MRIHHLLLMTTLLSACGPASAPRAPSAEEAPVDQQQSELAGWAAVRALLVQRAAAGGVSDLGLMVFDAQDDLVFQHMVGTFTPTTRVAVASASKFVSGIVLFELVKRGQLSLDSTTGAVLGWTGPKASITLRHLLSFTSGMNPENVCTTNPDITLATCVAILSAQAPVAAPGTRFDYGSTHLHVAARMAEVVTGKTWNTLFSDILRAPLGQATAVSYYSRPRQALGTQNPLIAGGLRASMSEYADFLRLAFHKGQTPALTVGTPALFDTQAREPYDVVIGNSPMQGIGLPFHYGLTAWLECLTPAQGCTRLSSPGAFGFTPWMDRESGYYAILGMELTVTAGEGGVAEFSVNLERDLAPLIRDALAP
ncbi:beta-lactamase family protein [Myxococcus sp. K15C18031901]|uniref:serine hydrolase domain-containing protein n=1 Tax=Myxococcus dinghuensis TaxID=2906761 RepID=UPI0020A7F45D|nr:serine hydrolase domain-containing protein [Myxococcus dinghuensis]MCP3102144.1 beta-lactamase family protein [Myxococcus dinghuensis]